MATVTGVAQLASHTPNEPCQMPYQAVYNSLKDGMNSMSSLERCPSNAKPMGAPMGAVYGSPQHYQGQPSAPQQQQQQQQQYANVGRTGAPAAHPAAMAAAAQQQQSRPVAAMANGQQQQQQQKQAQGAVVSAYNGGGGGANGSSAPSKGMPASQLEQLIAAVVSQAGGVAALSGHEDDVRRAISAANDMANGGYRVNAKMLSEMKTATGVVNTYHLGFTSSLKALAANPKRAEMVIPWSRIMSDANVTNTAGMVISVHMVKFRNKLPASLRMDMKGVEGQVYSPEYNTTALAFFEAGEKGDYVNIKGEHLYTRKFSMPLEDVQKYAGSDIDGIFAHRTPIAGSMSMVTVNSPLHQFMIENPDLCVKKFGKVAKDLPTVGNQFMIFNDRRLEETYQELKAIKSQMQEQSFADGLPVTFARADGRKWDAPEGVCEHFQGHVATDILEQPGRFAVRVQIGFLLPQVK